MSKGYIYVRRHDDFDQYNVCKVGQSSNIISRDSAYATNEFKRGKFVKILEMDNYEQMEKNIHRKFKHYHRKIDGGDEFFDLKIIDEIEPYLKHRGIHYIVREIDELLPKKITVKLVPKVERDYQVPIIEKTLQHFHENDKGLLVEPCGIGKTYIAIRIAEHYRTILIGVPSNLLLRQWKKEIGCFNNILCVNGEKTEDDVIEFIQKQKGRYYIITTYSSSYKLLNASIKLGFTFEMKILDEVHHLATTNLSEKPESSRWIQCLSIPSHKQLGLTATLRTIVSDEGCISNTDLNYFGKVIDQHNLLWAIQNDIVCDYTIQTLLINEADLEQYNLSELDDKTLFLAAYSAVRSIFQGNSTKILIYSNNKKNCILIQEYVKLISESYVEIPELFCSAYYGEMGEEEKQDILNQFNQSQWGIISCVYCLGEGYDNKSIDGVVFAENMTSSIRIVQSALRACRRNHHKPKKIANLIIPILNLTDWLNEDCKFEKLRTVVYEMGQEDSTVEHKIKVFRVSMKHKPERKLEQDDEPIGVYDDEITEQIRLRTIQRIQLDITYEKAKRLLQENNIHNKSNYELFCQVDARLPKDPIQHFGTKFKCWIDYLGVHGDYYDLETCRDKVQEYLRKNPKQDYFHLSRICEWLCSIDDMFPPPELWVDYYKVNRLDDIIKTNKTKKVEITF
jgi:superfamily II DNA or RNA helicase